MSYTEVIEKLNVYLWLIDFLIFLAVLRYANKDKAFSSTLVTLLVAIVLGGVMTAYAPGLKALIRENKPPGGDTTWFNIGMFSWYVGFVFFNMVATLAIWKIHVWYSKNYSYVAYVHLLAYVLLSTLQVLQYTETLTFNQGYMAYLYKYGVLSINISVSLTALVVLIGVSVSRYRIKNGKKGLSWSL